MLDAGRRNIDYAAALLFYHLFNKAVSFMISSARKSA
jgi:hypothetical protein